MQERRNLFINNVYLLVVIFFVVTVGLIYTKSILIPFTISVFIYATLSPLIHWCETNLKINRMISILIALFLFLLTALSVVLLITNSFESFFRSADIYKEKLLGFIQWGVDMGQQWGVEINASNIQQELAKLPVFSITRNLTGGLLSFLGNIVLIVIFVLFLLIGGGSGNIKEGTLGHEIRFKIFRYLGTKVSLSLLTALFVWIVLIIFGVELASTFAVLTFFLNFIPTIGSIVATLLPLPILLLQFGLGPIFFAVLALSGLIQFCIGSIFEPKIMGENLDLHPIVVLLFLMFWGLVWGIPGMFMAVPITAIKRIVFARIEATRPLAEILAGRIG